MTGTYTTPAHAHVGLLDENVKGLEKCGERFALTCGWGRTGACTTVAYLRFAFWTIHCFNKDCSFTMVETLEFAFIQLTTYWGSFFSTKGSLQGSSRRLFSRVVKCLRLIKYSQ